MKKKVNIKYYFIKYFTNIPFKISYNNFKYHHLTTLVNRSQILLSLLLQHHQNHISLSLLP